MQVVRRCLKTLPEEDFEEEAAAPQSKDLDHKPRKVKHTYTLRDVVKENHRSLIDSQIPYPPGEPEYIARFQAAVTTVLNNMTEEDLENAQNTVEQWNQEGAPSQVQLKSVFNVSSIIGHCSHKDMRKAFPRGGMPSTHGVKISVNLIAGI